MIWVVDCEPLGDSTAHRMPNYHRRENTPSLQELREVCGEIMEAIAGLRMARITVAPLCQSDCMNGFRKVSENGKAIA